MAKCQTGTASPPSYAVIDLFAGIGCVAQGFEATGRFDTVLLNDIDKDARETYVTNYPSRAKSYLRRDISTLTPARVLNISDGRDIHGVLGCPPCQGFSAAGLRDEFDERNAFVRDYFRLVTALKPPFIVMENVPRILQYDLFRKLLTRMERDYVVCMGVLNAALYGVPQTRQRAIVIGFRRDLGITPSMPAPSHLGRRQVFEYATKRLVRPGAKDSLRLLGLYPEVGHHDRPTEELTNLTPLPNASEDLVLVGDAIGDLPQAIDSDHPLRYTKPASAYAQGLKADAVLNHQRWNHRPELLRRLEPVPEGGGLLDEEYGRSRERPYFSQAYTRLHRRGLARTVTTNFHNAGSGRFLHYSALRTITVREAARLQGIPDSFAFVGFQSVQERLVGNAFPVPLAKAIATHVASQLDGAL